MQIGPVIMLLIENRGLSSNFPLRAKTALEAMAIEHLTGQLVMPPQSASVEAEYNEQYILWAGPIIITKFLHDSEPLLADFSSPLIENIENRENALWMCRYRIRISLILFDISWKNGGKTMADNS
jgi:hypothetical protein